MRILFTNTLLIDGSGDTPRKAAVIVEDDQIAGIATESGEDCSADLVIDAEGLALCPGFIDTHSHSDLIIFEEPMVWPKLRQGITTEFYGQDGISMAPLPEEFISRWRKNIAGLDGVSDAIDWKYKTTDGYLKLMQEKGVGPNVCYLVPHGNVRMEAMGLGEQTATETQLQKMCDILKRELNSGGFGLSTGLIYPPCTYADKRELTALCQVAANNNVPLVIHQRSEADGILESMEEVLQIGRETGVHVHFSHFKICGKYNNPKFPGVLELLDKASAEGLRVTFDQYPYTAGSTMLSAILPPWAHAGGSEEMLKRLADPELRRKIHEEINSTGCTWDNFVAFAGTEGISVTHVQSGRNTDAVGKNLDQIAAIRGTDPVTAALDLILDEENGVSMVDFYGLEKHVKGFMQRPEMNVCTDGLMHGMVHPRTYGAFPRVLGHYSRNEGLMAIEEAVRKMTLQPATTFSIPKRGKIAEGWYADLILFNPETVIDTSTYTEPRQHPAGIELVMVNGQIAFASDRIKARDTGADGGQPSGRVLRK